MYVVIFGIKFQMWLEFPYPFAVCLCQLCKVEEDTFSHLLNKCPRFYLDQCDLMQNQPIVETTDWDIETLVKFTEIEIIYEALSYNVNKQTE